MDCSIIMEQTKTRTMLFYMNFVKTLTRTFMKRNFYYVLTFLYMRYLLVRLQKILQKNLSVLALPDDILTLLITKHYKHRESYVDYNSCVLGNIKCLSKLKVSWYYICHKKSLRKYKVLIIPFDDGKEDVIFVSETMKYNIDNAINVNELKDSYFVLPSQDDFVNFASEVKISMISCPYEYRDQTINTALENYFSIPRYLRANDVFSIDIKDYAEDQIYFSGSYIIPVISFKVTTIRLGKNISTTDGCFIVYGETTLIQETNIHSYLPRKHYFSTLTTLELNNDIKESLTENYSPTLIESLAYLESCILPFTKGTQLDIKPVFLVSGLPGCGKRTMIKICAERMGMNLLNVDFAEVQTLTSAQTEAKLSIVLRNAEQCRPCILCLNNIQIFGKNVEGQKDERIISAFAAEVKALYSKDLKLPVIIIVTSDGSDLSAELQRMFIETIHMEHLDHSKRTNLLTWLLASKRLKNQANLSQITSLCSDFRFADLTALALHSIKDRFKKNRSQPDLILTEENFNQAYEYMQTVYSESEETPRVPKVHWDDIGGLEDLKHEIMRRIQLPLLNAFGFQQSGLLLYGPPGTGKTLLAKAVATEYKLHFLSIKGPEVLNMYVGQSEKNVRQIFERARAAAPCIIFFDELDSLAPNRGRSGDSGGVMDRVVSQLLSEMDGLEGSSSIFIIGATNRPDLIDPALLRPGRFDKMLYVGVLSDTSSQLSVLTALTHKFKLKNGNELELLLDKLPDYTTGADLYAVCSDAWIHAARRVLNERDKNILDAQSTDKIEFNNEVVVELNDFLEAIENLVPSVSKEEAERYEKLRMELSSK